MEVSPSLVLEALKKLSNAGALALSFFRWAEKRKGFQYNTESYHALIESLGKIKQFNVIWNFVTDMKQKGLLNKETFALISRRYARARKVKEAVEAFMKMEKFGFKIESSDINRLLDTLCKSRQASGFVPEGPTYNAVVGAYCWSERMHDVQRTIDEMRKGGVGPSARTYDIILHHLIRAGKTKIAYSVFQKMSCEGCEPSVSTYEIIVRMFCNEDRVDMAIKVWDQMKTRGILPIMHMFSTLINTLCHEGKLDEACLYFQEMLDVGIRPPAQLFSNLKQNLLDQGKKDTVVSFERKLDKLRKAPLVS
ncbi:hypothetical protein OIU76_011634 [Salix suchowensis]|nr:hypothetical protein OIU76_011634 [Salix suchowensis]